jgi:hypothetical protein
MLQSYSTCTSSAYEVHFVGVTGISPPPPFAYISEAMPINQLNIDGVPLLAHKRSIHATSDSSFAETV